MFDFNLIVSLIPTGIKRVSILKINSQIKASGFFNYTGSPLLSDIKGLKRKNLNKFMVIFIYSQS